MPQERPSRGCHEKAPAPVPPESGFPLAMEEAGDTGNIFDRVAFVFNSDFIYVLDHRFSRSPSNRGIAV